MEPDPEKAMPPLDQIKEVQEENPSVIYAGDSDADSRRSNSHPRLANKRPRSTSSSSSEVPIPILDPKRPGPWLLHHHKENIICKLKRPKVNLATKIYDQISKVVCKAHSKLFEEGNNKTSGATNDPPDDPEAENNWEKRRFRVSFAELQRMYLRKLQCKLVKDAVDMYDNDDEVPGWESNLREYSRCHPSNDATRLIIGIK